MANFKVVISDPASKKAYQKEVDQAQSGFVGKKIGTKLSGSGLGLEGYELEITGGSDKDGFPMRPDVEGPGRKKIILTAPPGYHPKRAGKRKRKSVRGNTVSRDVSQVNVKVVKAGSKKLEQLLGKKKEKAEEGKKDEAKPEAKKGEAAKPEAKPAEAKPAEGKPEANKEEAKPESKPAKKPEEKPAEEKMGIKKLDG